MENTYKRFCDHSEQLADLNTDLVGHRERLNQTVKNVNDLVEAHNKFLESKEYKSLMESISNNLNSFLNKKSLMKSGVLLCTTSGGGMLWTQCSVIDFDDERIHSGGDEGKFMVTYECDGKTVPKTLNRFRNNFNNILMLPNTPNIQQAIRVIWPGCFHNFRWSP